MGARRAHDGAAGRDVPALPASALLEVGERRKALWRMVLLVRYGIIFAGAACTVAIPAVGPERWWLALALVVLVAPYNAAYDLTMRRTGSLPPALAYTDQLITVSVVAFVPQYAAAVLMVMAALDAMAAVSFGRRVAAQAATLGAVGTGVALLAHGEGDALVPYLVYLLAATFVVTVVGGVAAAERAVRTRYAELVGGIDAIVWEQLTRRPSTLYVSDAAEKILGHPASCWAEPGFWARTVHHDDREWASRAYRTALERGENLELEYRLVAADGRTVHVHDHMWVVTDAEERVAHVRGVALDVTDRKAAEEQADQYVNLVERIHLAMFVFHLPDHGDDASLRLLAMNPRASRVTGLLPATSLGRPLPEVVGRADAPRWSTRLAEVVRTGEGFVSEEVRIDPADPDGPVYSAHAFPLPGDAVGLALHDITERVRATEGLRRQALHDGLTGLANRTKLHDRLQRALDRSADRGSPVALLVMDLDQFKEVNDALGHAHGDELLVEIGSRLRQVLPDVDLIARLGGDEFAVLLVARATEDDAVGVARRIRRALQRPFEVSGLALQANASIGIALCPEHATDAETLARRADVAMYTAKRAGEGVAVYAPEHDQSSVRRLALLGELRRAIGEDKLRLHFQPTLELATGRVTGVEALVRWAHPELGLVPPSQFIELAELSGAIGALTRWVLEAAVGQLVAWDRAGVELTVAVNLSARNLYDSDLATWLGLLVRHRDVPPGRLQLELTESQLMHDPALAMDVLHRLRSLGVAMSIDDFGTGYSSLAYLKQLPIDHLKIDRSFVAAMARDASDRAIVRSTIELSHDLGLGVVAEGVEDAATLHLLAEMGCDRAQGFFLSEPMAAGQVAGWLADPVQRHRLHASLGRPLPGQREWEAQGSAR